MFTPTKIFAGLLGLTLIVGLSYFIVTTQTGTTHPIGTSTGDTVHVHTDFQIYIGNDRVRLTDEKYQADATNRPHTHLHLHDGNDEVLHRHANDVTFTDFVNSLGYTLTDTCLRTDTGVDYCTDDENQLLLFINGEAHTPPTGYVSVEGDRVLLYYGNPSNPNLSTYLNQITDNACIYSGTCPERGVPPPENCGLTCEM